MRHAGRAPPEDRGAILTLGDDDPATQAWLRAQRGTTQPQLGREVFARGRRGRDPRTASYMRLLAADADRRRRRGGRTVRGGPIVLEFWAADWTPWQAIRRLRRDWPALRFAVAPRYDDG